MMIPVYNLPQVSDDRWRILSADPIDRILHDNQLSLFEEEALPMAVEYISARKYAGLIGVHYNTVLRWIHAGLIVYQRTPGGYLVSADTHRPKR